MIICTTYYLKIPVGLPEFEAGMPADCINNTAIVAMTLQRFSMLQGSNETTVHCAKQTLDVLLACISRSVLEHSLFMVLSASVSLFQTSSDVL